MDSACAVIVSHLLGFRHWGEIEDEMICAMAMCPFVYASFLGELRKSSFVSQMIIFGLDFVVSLLYIPYLLLVVILVFKRHNGEWELEQAQLFQWLNDTLTNYVYISHE